MSRPGAFAVSLNSPRIGTLPPDYVSLALDTSLVLGGHWWGKSAGLVDGVSIDTVAPLDLRDSRLRAFAALLAPAMLRIGGTEADRVGYRIRRKKHTADFSGTDDERALTLKKKLWKRVNSFARDAGFELLFVVGAGPEDRDESGAWKSASAERLIAFTAKKDYPVRAWELGNEVNGYPYIYGRKHRISAARYSADFLAFTRLLRRVHPGAIAVGPSSAIWPIIGEPNPIISHFARSGSVASDDVLSWHYYPQQSSRGTFANRRARERTLLSPRRLDGILRHARRIVKAARGREVWLTETGHALYGGEPGLSDTFLSSIWWLDQLGLTARVGIARVFRQSLVGSDYGLLDQETFEPRPDYYASFLWKRLMGDTVFDAPGLDGPDAGLRAYLHSHAKSGKKRCLLVVNLRAGPASLSFRQSPSEKYCVEGVDGLRSKRLQLNKTPVAEDLLFEWGKKAIRRKYEIETGIAEGSSTPSRVTLSPFSYAFLVFRTDGSITRDGSSFIHT